MSVLPIFHTQFIATAFQAHTQETHQEHCSMLLGEIPDHAATTYGLTLDSILNKSRYFVVTKGLAPDCMHDLLEGTMQYEVGVGDIHNSKGIHFFGRHK